MTSPRLTIGLCGVCLVALLSLWALERYATRAEQRPDARIMRDASARASHWFRIVLAKKAAVPGLGAATRHEGYSGLLGDEYSEFTTTLGSHEAKETTLNPDFAALCVRLLDDAGIDSTQTVGVTLSGSFPALGISILAALRTLGIRAVMVSSLGASTYGANQPGATWIDIERWLRASGELRDSSRFITFGAEADTGGGISAEGRAMLEQAAARSGRRILVPRGIREAITERVQLFIRERISLLINIGGNQAVLGACVHSSTHANGFHRTLRPCADEDRGAMVEMNVRGVPVIHFLNIRDLAARYGLPRGTPSRGQEGRGVYRAEAVAVTPVAACIVLIVLILAVVMRWVRTPR